ncbi:MAG TPA: hypothetical protein VGE07_01435 [Herpetosiphonaceae bacterium]
MQTLSFVEDARRWVGRFTAALADFDIAPSPRLAIVAGAHLLCAYQFETETIAISFPEQGDPKTMLHRLLLRELLACASDADLERFLRCLLPYVVAHELVHHLRHRRGLLTDDSWREEEIANECASVLTKPRHDPAELAFVLPILARSRAELASRLAATTPNPLSQHMRYMLDQIEWLHRDLLSAEQADAAECFRRHLGGALASAEIGAV